MMDIMPAIPVTKLISSILPIDGETSEQFRSRIVAAAAKIASEAPSPVARLEAAIEHQRLIAERGGMSRSPKKIAAARANVAKARQRRWNQ